MLLQKIFYEKGFNKKCPECLCRMTLYNNSLVYTEDHDQLICNALQWPCTAFDITKLVTTFYQLPHNLCLADVLRLKQSNNETRRHHLTATHVFKSLVKHCRNNAPTKLDAKTLLGQKIVRTWASKLPYTTPRQETQMSTLHHAILQDFNLSLTSISFVHIQDIELCKTKCVPNNCIDKFVNLLCVVMCPLCMGKSSNFSTDKKTGWHFYGQSGVISCVRCRQKEMRVFDLADCRVASNGHFISNFYAFFIKPTKVENLLKPVWEKHVSPCMANRACYKFVWNCGPNHFKTADCGRCEKRVTCEENCLSAKINDTHQIFLSYLSKACNGCIISMLCSCNSCLYKKWPCKLELLKWLL